MKSMEIFSLEKENCKVRFVSDIPLISYYEKNKDLLEFFNAKVILENDSTLPTLYYANDNSKRVFYENRNLFVLYPSSNLTPSNILYIGYPLLEREFGKKGLCSCHSACIEKDGVATLLLGEAGAGKTSVAINLCKKNGYSLISNDCSLIGLKENQLCIFGGTKFIRLRYDSVQQNMPELLSYFQKEDCGWTNKILVMPDTIGIKQQSQTIPIQNVIFLHVDNRKKELQIEQGDNWRNNFMLYQNLSSHIRGNAATAVDYLGHPIGFIPSFDDEETYQKRMKIIQTINELDNYYSISGNLQDTMEFIQKLSKKGKVKVLRRER